MNPRPRCQSCGQILRQYQQRASPTRDKVIALLTAHQPRTAHDLAQALGIKTTSLTRHLHLYAEQGFVVRAGLERHTHQQTFTRAVSKRTHTAAIPNYRTLWGLP